MVNKRSRPKQHTRRMKSGKRVVVNKGVKKRKVYKGNSSKSTKKTRKRPLGTKITYKPVGQYQTAFDEYGNIRGSRVIQNPKALEKSSTNEEITRAEIKELDTKYRNREISYEDYVKQMNSLLL